MNHRLTKTLRKKTAMTTTTWAEKKGKKYLTQFEFISGFKCLLRWFLQSWTFSVPQIHVGWFINTKILRLHWNTITYNRQKSPTVHQVVGGRSAHRWHSLVTHYWLSDTPCSLLQAAVCQNITGQYMYSMCSSNSQVATHMDWLCQPVVTS